MLRATSAGSVLLALLTIWLPPRMPAQDAPLYHLAMRVIAEPAVFDGYIDWGLPLSGGAVQLLGGRCFRSSTRPWRSSCWSAWGWPRGPARGGTSQKE